MRSNWTFFFMIGMKMAAPSLLTGALLLLCAVGSEGRSFIRLCYFPSWAYGRTSRYTRFDVQHVDPSLCTHLVHAFAAVDLDSRRLVPMDPQDAVDLDSRRLVPMDPQDAVDLDSRRLVPMDPQDAVDLDSRRLVPMDPHVDPRPGSVVRYQRFNDLKKTHPHLRTLVSVGGQYAGNEQFAHIASNDHYLQTFVSTTVDFLRQRHFDGLDIDWEYPNATTKVHYSTLLKALRTAFDADKTREERPLLTFALPAGRQHIDPGYDIGVLNRYVDLASVMTYDYHGSWDSMTSFDSPLFSRKSDSNFNPQLSTDWTISYYISRGLAADKIVVGVTAAGTHFKLRNSSLTGEGAPVVKADRPRVSDHWQLEDRFAFPEICRVLQRPLSHRVFDEEQQVPNVHKGDDWFGYEDAQSLTGKVDWMLKKGVAGAMFWALDLDDFTGEVCNMGTFPLLRVLSHSVGQIEEPHLTDHVNPNIRYLTKYTGNGGDGGVIRGRRLDSVVAVVVVVVLMVMMPVVDLSWKCGKSRGKRR